MRTYEGNAVFEMLFSIDKRQFSKMNAKINFGNMNFKIYIYA